MLPSGKTSKEYRNNRIGTTKNIRNSKANDHTESLKRKIKLWEEDSFNILYSFQSLKSI